MNESLDSSVRRWGSVCHLAGLAGFFLNALGWISGIQSPLALFLTVLLGALSPYIVWKLGRDRHSFIDAQGREAINFQISMTIYRFVTVIVFALLLVVITIVITPTPSQTGVSTNWNPEGWYLFLLLLQYVQHFFYGVAIIAALFALFMIAVILFAALKASRGQSYRYPFTIRFLRQRHRSDGF